MSPMTLLTSLTSVCIVLKTLLAVMQVNHSHASALVSSSGLEHKGETLVLFGMKPNLNLALFQ